MDETVFASYCEALSQWEDEQEEKQHLFTITGREGDGSQEQVSSGLVVWRTYLPWHSDVAVCCRYTVRSIALLVYAHILYYAVCSICMLHTQ